MSDELHQTRGRTFGRENASLRIVIFHGLTSSPDEFVPLAQRLAIKFDAFVTVPLLPGHGTAERDLLRVSFDELLRSARATVREQASQASHLILIGNSLGGFLALLCADIQKPAAIVISTTPYILRPRFRRPWMPYLMRLRPLWPKEVSLDELAARKHLFFYSHMPGNALLLLRDAIRLARAALPKIASPILTICNDGDPISYPISGQAIIDASAPHALSKSIVIKHDSHGLYYGPHKEQVERDIQAFIIKVTR